MRHTAQPLTAGDRHGFPVLFERALQRKAWCMASFEEEGSVVAVIGDLYGSLAAAHHGIRDDGLVGVHGDVLHGDLLLAFAAVAIERRKAALAPILASPSIIRQNRRQS